MLGNAVILILCIHQIIIYQMKISAFRESTKKMIDKMVQSFSLYKKTIPLNEKKYQLLKINLKKKMFIFNFLIKIQHLFFVQSRDPQKNQQFI